MTTAIAVGMVVLLGQMLWQFWLLLYRARQEERVRRALRVLGDGMMAGATSPARPWFKLETADPEMNNTTP